MVSYGAGVTIREAYLTSPGNVTLPLTSGTWQAVSGFELDMPAIAGEDVELDVSFMWQPSGSSAFLDLGVLVGSSIVRYASSGGGSPAGAGEGLPAVYINASSFRTGGPVFAFTTAAGDLDTVNGASTVRFALLCKTSSAAGIVYASANYPFFWRAKNNHVVT